MGNTKLYSTHMWKISENFCFIARTNFTQAGSTLHACEAHYHTADRKKKLRYLLLMPPAPKKTETLENREETGTKRGTIFEEDRANYKNDRRDIPLPFFFLAEAASTAAASVEDGASIRVAFITATSRKLEPMPTETTMSCGCFSSGVDLAQ